MFMTEDVIDESVWLPKDVPAFTKERLNKGDVRINASGRPVIVPTSITTTLHDFGVLSDHHVEAARRFSVWRQMLAVALGVDRITKDMRSTEAGRERQEDDYVRLVKIMHATDLRIVTEAVDHNGASLGARLTELRASNKVRYSAALRSLRNTYLDAFDALHAAVKEITHEGT